MLTTSTVHMATHRAMMPGPRPTTQSGQGNVVDIASVVCLVSLSLVVIGVMGLPHALSGALPWLANRGRFGGGSGAALSVGGVAPGLPKHSEALFTDEQRLPNPALKLLSLAAPVLVAAMAAAAGECLRETENFCAGCVDFANRN